MSSHAGLEPVRISSGDDIRSARWMFEASPKNGTPKGAASKSPQAIGPLANMKRGWIERDFRVCLTAAPLARGKAPTLKPWITVVELSCAMEALKVVVRSERKPQANSEAKLESGNGARSTRKKQKKANRSSASIKGASSPDTHGLLRAVENGERDLQALLSGAHAIVLRKNLIEARMLIMEVDGANDLSSASKQVRQKQAAAFEKNLSKLETWLTWMDERQRSRMWRLAGEAATQRQAFIESREYFLRSLAAFDDSDVRLKLTATEFVMAGKTAGTDVKTTESIAQQPQASTTGPSQSPAPSATPSLLITDREATEEELKVVDRINLSLKAGDLENVAEESAKLIKAHTGSARAKWATDRIQESYLSLADKSDEKAQKLRNKILRAMESVDDDRIAEWARVAYNRGFYADAFRLARRSVEMSKLALRSAKTWAIAMEAAIQVEKFEEAKEICQILVAQHAGTQIGREAMLRLGLLEYRLRRYPAAITAIERLLLVSGIETLEVIGRHWLWRSLQKTGDAARATEQANILINKFPLSYYGLRARAELAAGVVEWSQEAAPKLQSQIFLTGVEKKTWERIQLLLEAGWMDEAQAEIQTLPPPTKSEEKVLRARLWAAAMQHQFATKLVNEAWDAQQELRRQPYLAIGFPREFMSQIEANASSRKIDPTLVLSLIKQESSFFMKAQSTAQAMGLMQLIPSTAREVAQDLKLGELLIPDDIFNPIKNIRMGTYYLSKLLRKYQNHVPLALAAYNAGPGKIDRLLRARPGLASLAQTRGTAPEDELWFDELPWDETSFYIKAILRNLVLYRMLDKGRVEMRQPVWSDAVAAVK